MTREEILASPELSRSYGNEYGALLRVMKNKDVARVAACANVSALVAGRERPVTRELLGRTGEEQLRSVLAGASDLEELRQGLAQRLDRQRGGANPFERLHSAQEYER